MAKNKKRKKYIKEYEWSNIAAMLKNNRRDPLICHDDFLGKNVLITGATSGIGRVTARKYAQKGANLICINRNIEKSEILRQEIESEFGVTCTYKIADLSVLSDIYKVAQELLEMPQQIDVLIHNAGVFLNKQELTEEGLDKVFVVHYLSSFIINYILKDKLKAQEQCRIILVNSEGHRFAVFGIQLDDLNFVRRRYTGLGSYGSAKTAQLLSLFNFQEYFEGSGVLINAMHPGAVKSETGQENGPVYRWFKNNVLERSLKPATISAEALYYLGVDKAVANISGKFFNLTTIEEPTPPALDKEEADKLWQLTLEMAKLN